MMLQVNKAVLILTLGFFQSRNPLECEIERRRQSEEEEDDGEDTSSSSQEFEDVGLREEKALSDSEIKVNTVQSCTNGFALHLSLVLSCLILQPVSTSPYAYR